MGARDKDPPEGKSFWRAGARKRWHSYFYPANNLPGVMLFGLIAVLGLVAVGAAGWSILTLGRMQREDAMLGLIGMSCLILGAWQAISLSCR